MPRGRDVDLGSREETTSLGVTLHFGVVRELGDEARVLHVDARGDRMMEIFRGRVARSFAFADVVSYAADDDDDDGLGEFEPYAEYLDDGDEGPGTTLTISVKARGVREGLADDDERLADDDSEADDDSDASSSSSSSSSSSDASEGATVELRYRLQTSADLRAARVVLERLAAGRLDVDPSPFGSLRSASLLPPLPGLDRRVLISGKLMCRLGRLGDGGARWISCHAIVVPGKLFLLERAARLSRDERRRRRRRSAPRPRARGRDGRTRDPPDRPRRDSRTRGSSRAGPERRRRRRVRRRRQPGRVSSRSSARVIIARAARGPRASSRGRAGTRGSSALERAAAACEEYDAFSADGGGAARRRGGDENGFFPGRSRAASA